MFENRHYYTDERNAQIVIARLKAHGIKRVIASQGTNHMAILTNIGIQVNTTAVVDGKSKL